MLFTAKCSSSYNILFFFIEIKYGKIHVTVLIDEKYENALTLFFKHCVGISNFFASGSQYFGDKEKIVFLNYN